MAGLRGDIILEHATLKSHRLKKGKFIAPWNDMGIEMKDNPWFQDRFPEYIWIGLILNKFGRNDGLVICNQIMQFLKDFNIYDLRFSEILSLKFDEQIKIWKKISEVADDDILTPLTIIFSYSEHPAFAKFFCKQGIGVDERFELLVKVLQQGCDHQSFFSTDIRFVVLYFRIIQGKIKFVGECSDTLKLILKYPTLSHEDEEMRMIRPIIRSAEIGINEQNEKHTKYLKMFWEGISVMSECNLYSMKFDADAIDADIFIEKTKIIMKYYTDMFVSSYPLDDKMTVLMGIATYSYKRLLELVNCNLYNEISGRSIVRVMIENYIMMQYLLKIDANVDDVWKEYQYYGIGQYKLIAKRFEDSDKNLTESHVAYEYLSMLVNEFKNEDFIDMDTSYFNKKAVREKAAAIGEKDLFGLYYDYDSAFEHGLWGAIRESSMLKCSSVGHQFHCVPDIDNVQKLKSAWPDAKMMMKKTINVLKSEYGLPEHYNY